MKDYFIRLFTYDKYANQVILKSIREANNPEKPIQLMGHLLAAQNRWLSRFLNEFIDNDLWPAKETIPFDDLINDNYQQWINLLNTLTPADFDKELSYKNTKGVAYSNKLVDVLTHLINHGTHHRAQIGQQLKIAGAGTLPNTDYINYVRN